MIVAHEHPEAVIERIASAGTHIISLTVTEKGYLLPDRNSGQEPASGSPRQSGSIYFYLQEGFKRRRANGLSGPTIVSCDNLASNGPLLAGRLTEFLEWQDPSLARWFEAECRCPSTMVDRIVPATTSADLKRVEARIGLRDEGAVITEPFSQWIIEDNFAGSRPPWELGGATFVSDVRPFEIAKLRMLNGAHSALAYLGLARGFEYVHEAIGDAPIRSLVGSLMRKEAGPTVPAVVETGAYADSLLLRFGNNGLPHKLRQIAMDGSQKIPQRWLHTLAERSLAGAQCPAILEALAAWVLHLRGDNGQVDDPMSDRLGRLWRESGTDGIAAALFGDQGVFSEHWSASPADISFLSRHLNAART